MIEYRKLDIDMLSAFSNAYRDFYADTEGKEMPGIVFKNWFLYTVATMDNPEIMNLMACDGDKVIGLLIGVPLACLDEKKTLMVDPLWVTPEYRGKGIVSELLRLGEEWTREHNIERLFSMENIDGKSLWSRKKHLGFKPYKTILVKE